MNMWLWQVTDRANERRDYEAFEKGWRTHIGPHIYAEGTAHSRKEAIEEARRNIGTSSQIIRVWRIKCTP